MKTEFAGERGYIGGSEGDAVPGVVPADSIGEAVELHARDAAAGEDAASLLKVADDDFAIGDVLEDGERIDEIEGLGGKLRKVGAIGGVHVRVGNPGEIKQGEADHFRGYVDAVNFGEVTAHRDDEASGTAADLQRPAPAARVGRKVGEVAFEKTDQFAGALQEIAEGLVVQSESDVVERVGACAAIPIDAHATREAVHGISVSRGRDDGLESYSERRIGQDDGVIESPALRLSVVIPIYATGPEAVQLLRQALARLRASSSAGLEILVVDDASPESAEVRRAAVETGAQVLRLERRSGPAAARNAGVRATSAEVIAFFDADTTVHTDTVERLERKLREVPKLDAVMGSYDQAPPAPGLVSQFRNLLHSFVHHGASRRAWTFWAGCSAIRREAFLALGGFDERFGRPAIEDVEFGLRLWEAGGEIELDPSIQVTHHKRWTLASMVRTDLFERAIPWAVLFHGRRLPRDLNFRTADRVGVLLTAALPLLVFWAFARGGIWWLPPAAAIGAIAALNVALFRFLARAIGWWNAVRCFAWLLVYLATCAVGLMAGTALAILRRRTEVPKKM